jgi:hypothetical protein
VSTSIEIIHRPSQEVIAVGKRSWSITPFEGNYYISSKCLKTDGFKVNYVPGLCVYKFVYVWMDFHARDGHVTKNLGWKYFLPNPIFPFIWFRVAIPVEHPDLIVVQHSTGDPTPIEMES